MSEEQLPGWRRPNYGVPSSVEHGSAAKRGLDEAIVELTSDEPLALRRLVAELREQWGDASYAQVRSAVGTLVRRGALARVEGGYVRAEQDGDR